MSVHRKPCSLCIPTNLRPPIKHPKRHSIRTVIPHILEKRIHLCHTRGQTHYVSNESRKYQVHHRTTPERLDRSSQARHRMIRFSLLQQHLPPSKMHPLLMDNQHVAISLPKNMVMEEKTPNLQLQCLRDTYLMEDFMRRGIQYE